MQASRAPRPRWRIPGNCSRPRPAHESTSAGLPGRHRSRGWYPLCAHHLFRFGKAAPRIRIFSSEIDWARIRAANILCHRQANELQNGTHRPRHCFMKPSISLALFTALFISACSEPEPPPRRHRAATYPADHCETQYPPVQQPFDPARSRPPPPDYGATAGPRRRRRPRPPRRSSRPRATFLTAFRSRETRVRHQSLCARPGICRRARLPARNGSARSLHEQNLPRPLTSRHFVPRPPAILAARRRRRRAAMLDISAQLGILPPR